MKKMKMKRQFRGRTLFFAVVVLGAVALPGRQLARRPALRQAQALWTGDAPARVMT